MNGNDFKYFFLDDEWLASENKEKNHKMGEALRGTRRIE